MNVSSIYTLARTLSYTDSVQSPDTTLEVFANLVYHDLENTIVSQVDEDFFYQEWTTNTIIGQNEYTLPVKSGTTAGCKKLLSVNVKQKTGGDLIVVPERRITDLSENVNVYATATGDIFYYTADNSYFIFPTPIENITGGIKLYGISNLGDIATGGAETTVLLPIQYHDLIAQGMLQYIYQARGMLNEAQMALNLYNQKKAQMVRELTDRTAGPAISVFPNLNY